MQQFDISVLDVLSCWPKSHPLFLSKISSKVVKNPSVYHHLSAGLQTRPLAWDSTCGSAGWPLHYREKEYSHINSNRLGIFDTADRQILLLSSQRQLQTANTNSLKCLGPFFWNYKHGIIQAFLSSTIFRLSQWSHFYLLLIRI